MCWPNVGQKCAAQDLRLLLCPLVGKAFQFYSRWKKSEDIFYVGRIMPATVFCQLSSISLIDLVLVIVNAYFGKDERGFAKHEGFLPSPKDNVAEDDLGFSFSSLLLFKLGSSKMHQWKKLGT